VERWSEGGTVPALAPAHPTAHYSTLALDYGGTVAVDGRVAAETVAALERARGRGRRLVLVTSATVAELRAARAPLELFDRVIAENGGVVLRPADGDCRALAGAPPLELVAALAARGVDPLRVGATLVATAHPHQGRAAAAIRELGVDYHVVFNRRTVLVVPGDVSAAATLGTALAELGVSPRDAVGVGDAQDDISFLSLCGLAVAVGNALPSVKRSCHAVATGAAGTGVAELVDALPGTWESAAA
jgi:hydroxymethylpyrimidine pyrophosphatase-like HAD family hydrolase